LSRQIKHRKKGFVNRLAVLLLAGFVAACQSQPSLPPSPQTEQSPPPTTTPAKAATIQPVSPKQADCPNLDSQLFQLTQATAPLDLAQERQFRVKGDKIQVLLILADTDITFLQNFEVEPGTQMGAKIQVFAPIDQLCNLANTPQVLAIRPPARLFTP
jgi:hypothetical protein